MTQSQPLPREFRPEAPVVAPFVPVGPNFLLIMPDTPADPGHRLALARLIVAGLMQALRLAIARRAQGGGEADGARSPAGPARRPVELVTLVEHAGDGQVHLVTPRGYRTARAAVPRVLACLPEADARRAAAARYAHLHEVVEAAPCGPLVSVRVDGGGRISDGGAVWRAGLAAELSAMQACLAGDLLAPRRGGAGRRVLTLRAAVDGVCLHGQEVKAVLRAHGWSDRGASVGLVTDLVHQALERMVDVHTAS